MAPELLEELETGELRQIAEQIKQHQDAKGYSFSALLKRYPGIGSDKTFNKILRQDFAELDVEKWLINYRAVWALIESLGDDPGKEEELYDDLYPAVQLRKAFVDARRDHGSARVILLEADTGGGKTCAQRVLREKYGQSLLKIEAHVAWNDSPIAMLGDILAAFGVKNPPLNQMFRFNAVVERLNNARIGLVIEEGHHMGPKCLNLCKTLINHTPGEIIILAMPSLWARLESSAYQEVRQLVGNRLAERIKLAAWKESDVRKFIARRVPALEPIADKAAKLVMPHMKAKGNMGFVREVCKRAVDLGDSLDLEQFAAAVTAELESR